MWADNETDVDLLGFDFLVDALVVALTEPRLLPLTVGLLGDWGSGKSSLMKITRQELLKIRDDDETPSRYACVEFSPWQYEDYDDVKVALMTKILDEVSQRTTEGAQQEQVSRLRGFAQNLSRWRRTGGRLAVSAAPLLLPTVFPDIDPTLAEGMLAGVAGVAGQPPEEPQGTAGEDDDRGGSRLDAGRFRAEFAELVASLDGTDAVVVFIDDLDRCLPGTVVDTFEAIRLFLNTPKTAYVIAANQAVVESAIDSRYPQLQQPGGGGIGANYLEKMLQIKVVIPPLSAPEADTYANLLLAELHLDDDQFAAVLDETRERRVAGVLQVAFNLGVADEVLDDVPATLAHDLDWAASISQVLGTGLRGNPRQLKRFLNNLLLKQRSAERRGVTLQLPVLAKLMALEEQHVSDFQRLYDWQLTAPGPIPELAAAESVAAPPADREGSDSDEEDTAGPGEGGRPDRGPNARRSSAGRTRRRADDQPEVAEEVRTWAGKPHIAAWLQLPPSLREVDLRPYFTYSRDRLTLGVAVTRLPPRLQELLTKVQSEVAGVRRGACGEIVALPAADRLQVVEALVEVLARRADSPAFVAALELAARAPDILQPVCEALTRIPPAAIPVHHAGNIARLPADNPLVAALLDRWGNSTAPGLAPIVRHAREMRQLSGSR
ncbi:hypothetical protein ACG83_37625 [Frankia sp. R43]|uniref:KAP family P-loop NTPase fold protein n=1 Tax=Frankia sp. R43 TaxID=269536 RepID=UPI0006CA12F7|nr:P-loop NTPase fold protein [Frankia sp. R43]KPM51134.1 hypothetical protein ACG83_37625 [Frankia sp. R43]